MIGENEQEEIAKLGAHQEPDAATTTREVKVDQQVSRPLSEVVDLRYFCVQSTTSRARKRRS